MKTNTYPEAIFPPMVMHRIAFPHMTIPLKMDNGHEVVCNILHDQCPQTASGYEISFLLIHAHSLLQGNGYEVDVFTALYSTDDYIVHSPLQTLAHDDAPGSRMHLYARSRLSLTPGRVMLQYPTGECILIMFEIFLLPETVAFAVLLFAVMLCHDLSGFILNIQEGLGYDWVEV